MKKLVKKILTIACSMVLCLVCLTGCSWLEINKDKYYNQIVATVGDNIAFTKKDLVEAFSNYGYQYVQQYGLSMEESVKKTIDSMIDRELLMNVVKEEVEITDKEELEIRKQAFDYMQDSINTFEDKIRKEWEITIETNKSTEKEPMRKAETKYEPTTEYREGKVSRIEKQKDAIMVPDNLPENFTKEYRHITEEKVSNEAWTRYIKSLQDLAKAEGRDTTESVVLKYEQDRLIDLIKTNTYLDKYQREFLKTADVDTESVLTYFRQQFDAEKEKYASNESLYHEAMKKSSSEYVYYHHNSGNEYVNVKHILVNFSEDQKEEIKLLDSRFGVTKDNTAENEEKKKNPEYQRELKRITDRTYSTFEMSEEMYNNYAQSFGFEKVEGKENTYKGHISDIYNFVRYYVQGSTLKTTSSRFNELVYVFNDDGGFMDSEFDYVVNLDTSIQDQMVKPFADGVRALDKSNGGEGEGSMDMIISEYGFHIIYHDGVAKNIIDSTNISDEQLLAVLCTQTTTPESNKTIFNYIYDKLKLDAQLYDNMTQKVVANEKTQLKENNIVITYYEKHYKDLFE